VFTRLELAQLTLHQQVVCTPERHQPAFNGGLPVLDAGVTRNDLERADPNHVLQFGDQRARDTGV